MSAIHERRYRMRREREIAEERVKKTTEQYVERYENILDDLRTQGLQEYVIEDFRQIKSELNELKVILNQDAFQAREISLQIGYRIHALPRIARQARDIDVENERLEKQEREQQAQEERRKEHEQLEQAWHQFWLSWTDKLSRNMALKELSNLRKQIFGAKSSYTVQQIQKEMQQIKQVAEQKAVQKRQLVQQTAEQEAKKQMVEHLLKEVQQENLPVIQTEELIQQAQKILSQPEVSLKQFQTLAQQTDQALENEAIRRKMVIAVLESLRYAGFSVLKPTKIKSEQEDVVIIQARRPSGNQAKFKIQLDGKVRYEFDNYKGQTCKEDMEKVLPRLAEVYGVDLSNERVIWSNPDDELQDMRPITPNQTQQR
jgi:hypothetical protein